MRWVGLNLKQFLSSQEHILRDSDHLLECLRRVRIPSSAGLVKFDTKDFFMSGRRRDISSLASKCFPDGVQLCAKNLNDSIIRNQVITVPGVDKYWRDRVGRGMGLRQRFRVLFFCRIKDDGFFVIDGR